MSNKEKRDELVAKITDPAGRKFCSESLNDVPRTIGQITQILLDETDVSTHRFAELTATDRYAVVRRVVKDWDESKIDGKRHYRCPLDAASPEPSAEEAIAPKPKRARKSVKPGQGKSWAVDPAAENTAPEPVAEPVAEVVATPEPVAEKHAATTKKRQNLDLYYFGLSDGDVLTYAKDDSVTVEVAAKNRVKYAGGEIGSLTAAAKWAATLTDTKASGGPCGLWTHNGRYLWELWADANAEAVAAAS